MNATVTVTGIELSASNLPLPDVSTWFAWFYERNLDTEAGASVECSDIVATSSAEEISGTGDGLTEVNSAEIGSEFGSISSTGDAQAEINGLEIESEFGNVTAFESLNASVTVSGLEIVSILGDINTSVLNPDIIQVSGGSGRYSPQAFKNGFVKIAGVRTKITLGDVKSFGVVSIAARVNVQSVEMDLQAQTIAAEGILSIGDEELMLLLAA
jgi:hypothetical protein